MNILITDTLKVNSIQMKAWSDNDSRWSPDMFSDIADNMPTDYPVPAEFKDAVAGTDIVCAMTSKEFTDTVEWWENEIDLYNKRDIRSWFFDRYDEESVEAADDELTLFVEEDVMTVDPDDITMMVEDWIADEKPGDDFHTVGIPYYDEDIKRWCQDAEDDKARYTLHGDDEGFIRIVYNGTK